MKGVKKKRGKMVTKKKSEEKKAAKKKYPYPIKDWMIKEQYPTPKAMKGHAMAWEYLRRNKEYQEEYDNIQKNKKLKGKYGWFDRSKLKKWFRQPPTISFIPNPLDDKPKGLGLFLEIYPRCYQEVNGRVEVIRRKGDKVIVFNLNIPLERQLVDAKKFLKSELKKSGIKPKEAGAKRDAMRRYWRVLDAKAKNVSNREIGNFFYGEHIETDNTFPHERAKGDYQRACEFRDETYISLIDLPQQKKK